MTYKSDLELDLTVSKVLAKRIKAKAKQCYHNAFLAMQRLSDATYVEGVILLNLPIAVEHAWLEWEGKIIDPTMCGEPLPFAKADQYKGIKITDGSFARVYFPVLRYTYDEVYDLLERTRVAGFLPSIHDRKLFTDEERKRYREAHGEAFLYDLTPEQREQLITGLDRLNNKIDPNQTQT